MRLNALPFLLAASLGATAAQADDAALQALAFGHALGRDGGYACFTRHYAKTHLAAHKKQNVTSIMLLLQAGHDSEWRYTAGVDFRFRKSNTHYQAYGSCTALAPEGEAAEANALHCGIDCDGGTINVSLRDASTIIVKLPDGIAVTDAAGTDSEGPSASRFGSDDKVFKLTRTSPADCLPLAASDEEKAALEKMK